MKIAIIGARGIPANYGGFETFAEEIAINLVERHFINITVVCDRDQKIVNNSLESYKGVKLLYSKYSKSKNPISFYYDSVQMVAKEYDIIYSCGPAGGIFGPIVHRHGNLLITNPDGLNWRRAKWNKLVQTAFRTFEYLATKFSDYLACDSYGIEKHIQDSYGCQQTFVAEYGAYPNQYVDHSNSTVDTVLSKYGLVTNEYHLVVSRLEPENHVHIILDGYCHYKRKFPLIIVGNLKENKYIKYLQETANSDVRFVGGIYNKEELEIVRANAIDYLHGHSVGGTNPSLLEAMASKNLCICHDNVFNREVIGENGLFFQNDADVSQFISQVENNDIDLNCMREKVYEKIISYYNWDAITDKYYHVFEKILSKREENAK